MKYFIPACLSLAFVFSVLSLTSSCDNPVSQETTEIPDSVWIAESDNYINQINRTYTRTEKVITLANTGLLEEKIIWIETEQEGLLKILWGKVSDEGVLRQTFYFKNHQPAYFRNQTWLKAAPSIAEDAIHIFVEGKLKKNYRKFMELEPGKPPVNIRKMEYLKMEVDFAEKEAEILNRINEILKIRDENQ